MNSLMQLIKKECLEDFLASRGVIFLVVASGILSVFSILLVSNTELSLMDNAQAVYMMGGIIIALATMITVIRGSDSFAGERDRGTLETLMLTPVTGQNLAAGKLLAILFSWLILFVFSIPYIWAVASTGQNLWPAVVYLFITGTLLSLIFGELTIALSVRMKIFKGVLSIGLTISILSISPLILGASLRQNAIGRFIDMMNPFACALNTLDSVVIDSQGLAFQIPRLFIMLCYAIAIFGLLRITTRRVEL